MSGFIEKLGSYQIINNLLPGAFFGMALRLFLALSVPTQNVGEEIIVYYFMGLIISRISSLFVQPILIKLSFIKMSSYSEYIKATKVDLKIDTLSEINNYFRNLLTGSLLLCIIKGLQVLIGDNMWIVSNWKWVGVLFLILLFLFSYKKQTDIICARIKSANEQEDIES